MRKPFTISSEEPVARIVLMSDWPFPAGMYAKTPRIGLFESHDPYMAVFLNAVTAALNSVTSESGSGLAGVRHAIDHLFMSALVGDQVAETGGESQQNPVLNRATQAIRAHAGDPAFDVAALARALHLSPASLYRAYEGLHLSPSAQLRAARVERARTLLNSEVVDASTTDLKRIAGWAGFGSVRALRRALAAASPELEARSGTGIEPGFPH
ncbi:MULTISPECIES: AraC family transcriptional regulator [unclassified Pseudoclavibacter]|uniref:helix-turn-helix domain-containing protein n=1 Tax=unclassified Pseudoclavibacter TaxID=2615177 RepID=UPI0011B00F93|nr:MULTISPECIES: AraC family transcriptional regulator [unclassified Pseudoclavibacter]